MVILWFPAYQTKDSKKKEKDSAVPFRRDRHSHVQGKEHGLLIALVYNDRFDEIFDEKERSPYAKSSNYLLYSRPGRIGVRNDRLCRNVDRNRQNAPDGIPFAGSHHFRDQSDQWKRRAPTSSLKLAETAILLLFLLMDPAFELL
jgi:hypothetical protein